MSSYARKDDGSVNEHDGQVWRLDPKANTMELVVQFGVNPDPASDNFDGPDNITVAPNGGLILCSDGEGVQHLWMVSPTGEPACSPATLRRRRVHRRHVRGPWQDAVRQPPGPRRDVRDHRPLDLARVRSFVDLTTQ